MSSTSDDLLEVIDITEPQNQENQTLNHENNSNDDVLQNTDQLVYDRQIRLWGVNAQKKIMDSSVLFLGKNGIQEECMKNLLLAGMRVTLANDHFVSEQDVNLSFFLINEDIGKPHAVTLCQRMSTIAIDETRISGLNSKLVYEEDGVFKFEDPEFLKSFNVVCLSTIDFPLHKMVKLDETCRELNIAFFASLSCGTYGYFFTDLNRHTVKSEPMTIEYRSLNSFLNEPQFPNGCEPIIRCIVAIVFLGQKGDILNHDKEDFKQVSKRFNGNPEKMQEILDMYGKQFPVTSSILGGYLALEVRKFVTGQHETIPNFCVFDMNDSSVATAML